MERIDGIQSKQILCMQPTNTSLEEADNRIVLHIRDAIILRDKHVIIILLGFLPQLLQYNEDVMLSVDYGTDNFLIFININNCYQHIGESNALALQFFHALSGCDSTSFIYKKSKTVLFNQWMHSPKYEDLTEAFQKLSWFPSQQTIEECLPILSVPGKCIWRRLWKKS